MKKKKLLSLLIVLAMIAATVVMPMTASADGTKKTMNMGGSAIAVKDNIYYGNQTKWRVLSTVGNTTDPDGGTVTFNNDTVAKENALFVISENNFGTRKYNSSGQNWQGGEAQTWCNGTEDGQFYKTAVITDTEKAAILTTNKTDAANSDYKATSINDKVFYLSAKEVATYFDNKDDRIFALNEENVDWRLRSPKTGFKNPVGIVNSEGQISSLDPSNSIASRPAFNLNKENILFTSAADFNGTIGEYEGNEWKLTLKDSSREFAVTNVTNDGVNLTITYTGANTGDNEKISYIVTNADETEIKSYGNNATTAASGSVEIAIPVMEDTDKLFVFSEQDNGAKKTNYASELKEVTIPAAAPEYLVAPAAETGYDGAPSASVQAKKSEDKTSATMRFIWGVDFNGNETAPETLGVFFFNFTATQQASIENVDASSLTDKGFFFGDINDVTLFDAGYWAIPIVNGKIYGDAMIGSTVNIADIDK